jgi:hypothetical protein
MEIDDREEDKDITLDYPKLLARTSLFRSYTTYTVKIIVIDNHTIAIGFTCKKGKLHT